MEIVSVEDRTLLLTTPVPRNYPAKWLGKKTDKRLLYQDFVVAVRLKDGEDIVINVPEGYTTDGSSIPKIFHSLYHPFTTESYWAAVVHDYIYSHIYYKFSKEFADNLFRFMIARDGGSWLMQSTFYRAVRMNVTGGGWND